MKIDLVGPKRRGLAMGLNEFAGYLAVAGSALATGWIAARYGLRPAAVLSRRRLRRGRAAALGARRPRDPAPCRARGAGTSSGGARRAASRQREIFRRTSLTDRNLSSVSQAGLVNNLNDGMAWGLFPLFFAAAGMSLAQIGMLAAIYPAVWGVAQLFTGALSDRIGRKWLIALGHVGAGGGHRRHRRSRPASPASPSARCCSASARRWSIRRCWPRSATSRTRRGGRRRSASTGCGATSAMPSARCSPASPPTCSGWPLRCGWSPALTLLSGVVAAVRMSETLAASKA